jgi:hypothetical protein
MENTLKIVVYRCGHITAYPEDHRWKSRALRSPCSTALTTPNCERCDGV